jgi:osmoprotectant transport system permease protein
VQLPLAIPVIGAGLRVAAVSNVSLVSVAALLGIPQLGQLFTVGFQLDFYTPIIAGIVLCLVLAAVFDGAIQLAVRFSTPWTRAVKAR